MCGELGCCATTQKIVIVTINLILFLVGTVQVIIAILFLTTDKMDFFTDVVDGNNDVVYAFMGLGIVFVVISFWAFVGAIRHSKWMLWTYALILFLLIIGQSMAIAVTTVSVKYGDSIFGEMWQKLDEDTIDEIETRYECCSFHGNSNDTWTADEDDFEECSNENSFDPMQSCWEKFNTDIEDNYYTVLGATSVFMGLQIIIYLSTHYVIQSIAEADGGAEAQNQKESEMVESAVDGKLRV